MAMSTPGGEIWRLLGRRRQPAQLHHLRPRQQLLQPPQPRQSNTEQQEQQQQQQQQQQQ
eukprot:CAMPEP_0206471332 /NCGR_PEP_ID=MMETSP0324_2-20121206/31494_1 /ASSEMBLY_ACC=CAM_ASM_000836 /TAXON_ID=2866 /ORGANISM="Crypthecodinium cohnii, Strain Seligo" /LENGTH=58 /DNA_ID=CAMNT_0053945625 /DNA_START=157 /DNA_END=330 /DNA_ORIENTATION=+